MDAISSIPFSFVTLINQAHDKEVNLNALKSAKLVRILRMTKYARLLRLLRFLKVNKIL